MLGPSTNKKYQQQPEAGGRVNGHKLLHWTEGHETDAETHPIKDIQHRDRKVGHSNKLFLQGQKLKAFRYWYKLIVGQMDTPTNRFTTLRLKRSNLQPLVDCLLGPQKLFLPFLEKEKEEKEEESKYMKN